MDAYTSVLFIYFFVINEIQYFITIVLNVLFIFRKLSSTIFFSFIPIEK